MYAHSLMHSCFHLPSHFGEPRDVFWSSILHVFSFCFPHGACSVHDLALNEMLWSILIIPYSILFMHALHSSFFSNHVLGSDETFFLSSILHVFSFFLIVHAQSIIWISLKHCGPFWSFSIPFYLCTLCVCLACRTMFCFGLFACCYHPPSHKGLGSPLFGEWMSSGDHSILWERVVICGFLIFVVKWSLLQLSEWNTILLCWHCGLLCVHIFPWSELVWSGIGSELSW